MAPNKRKILESARKYAQKGQRDKALKEYDKLVKLDPRDAKLRLEIGDAYRRWGQVEEAISAYQRVAEQYMAEGFEARAVAVFKQIQNLDPRRYASYVPLADLYQRMGLTAEAIQALQTAADGYHREGKKREALELLRKMASLDPSNTTSRIKVAELLRKEGMTREAVEEYEQAYEQLDRQGETEASGSVLERILEIEPERSDALARLAACLLKQGQPDRAEPFARRARDAEPDEAGHFELLAEVYRASGRDRELAETYRGLADLYRERGDEDRAREIVQRFVPADTLFEGGFDAPSGPEPPDGEDGPTLLDEPLLEEDGFGADLEPLDAGGVEETVLDLSEVVEPETGPEATLGPGRRADDEGPEIDGDPEQLLAEASVYLRYGKRARAMQNLEAILAREPEHRGALEKLGEAHADGGQPQRAVEAWQRAAGIARAAGDATGLAVLRDRIGALDPEAARSLPAPAPEPELDELIELPDDDDLGVDLAAEEDADALSFDGEIEIEIDGDEELEIDAGEASGPPFAAGGDTDTATEDDAGSATGPEIEIDPEIEIAIDGAPEPDAGQSSLADELEEAEFYHQQGLLEEAEAAYGRILAADPRHAQAAARLEEIAAARGASATAEPGNAEIGNAETGKAEPASPPALEATEPETLVDEDPDEWTDDGLEEPELEIDLDAGSAVTGSSDEDTGIDFGELEGDAAGTDLDLEFDLDAEEELAPVAREPETALDLEPDLEPEAPAPRAPEAPPMAFSADGEGESFDLAAELSDVFDPPAGASSSGSGSALAGQSEADVFEAVFSEFKKGVRKQLSEGDYEAHYDLGIAYREMGLLEDALGEFRAAMGSPARRVDGLHMLGLCTLDLGRAEEAVGHFDEALAVPDIAELQMLAVRFELGRAREALGDLEGARGAWEQVAAHDPDFCEVEERLAILGREKPEPEAADGLESFDDLFEDEDEDEDAAAEDVAETESFEDLMEEGEPGDDATPAEREPTPAPPARRRKKISFV